MNPPVTDELAIPFTPKLFESFGRSPLGDLGFGFALVVIVALVLALILATIPMRLPGPVTRAERRNRALISLVITLFRGVLGPALLILGAVLTLLPYEHPNAMVLSSAAPSASSEQWAKQWKETTAALDPRAQVIDAGAISRAVCDELVTNPPLGGWNADSAASVALLRAAVLGRLLGTHDLPHPVRLMDVTHKPETRLPAWVVESVEIAVLKGIGQSRNVGFIGVQYEPRETSAGSTWHEGVRQYLQSSPVRSAPARAHLVRGASRAPLELLALGVDRSATPPRITVTVQLGETDGKLPDAGMLEALLHVLVGRPGQQELAKAKLEGVRPVPGIQFARLDAAGLDLAGGLIVRHELAGGELLWRERDPRGESERPRRPVRVSAPPTAVSQWTATLTALKGNKTLDEWRDRVRSDGCELIPVDAVSPDSPRGCVMVIQRPAFVWIGRAGSVVPGDDPAPTPGLPTRAINGRGGGAGVFDWPGLQLEGSLVPQRPDFANTDVLTFSHVTSTSLQSSARATSSTGEALVSVLPSTDADRQPYLATVIALNPQDTGLLIDSESSPGPKYSRENFLAFHTTLVQAVRRAAFDPGSILFGETSSAAAHPPEILLRPADLAAISGQAIKRSATTLGIGILCYALGTLMLMPLSLVPRRRGYRQSALSQT